MQRYGAVMRDITARELAGCPLGRSFPVHPSMQRITLDVILRTVFGMDEGASLDTLRHEITAFMDGFSPTTTVPALQRDLGPRSPWGRFIRARARVDTLLYRQIAARRAAGEQGRDDVLTLLLAARYEDGTPMRDKDLRDELITLLAAGHETTATELPWVFHYLAENPDVQAKVHEELDRVMGPGPVDPALADALPYLDAVVKETMRLRPVILAIGRVLQAPWRLGEWELPAGALVSASIYLAHHNPEVWPEPERFDPGRFEGGRTSPHAYFPFGGGARRCIGMAFALYEMRVVLATILRERRVLPAPGVRIRARRRGIAMAPSEGMPVVLERR
jgi:cytochrome P450 family 110